MKVHREVCGRQAHLFSFLCKKPDAFFSPTLDGFFIRRPRFGIIILIGASAKF